MLLDEPFCPQHLHMGIDPPHYRIVPCKDAALDVDTPGEYERLVAGWEDYSPGATG
ncbi:MAG: hypothetical protein ACXWQ8_16280 [Ktedonobacterales bacterium]